MHTYLSLSIVLYLYKLIYNFKLTLKIRYPYYTIQLEKYVYE